LLLSDSVDKHVAECLCLAGDQLKQMKLKVKNSKTSTFLNGY